MIEFEPSKMQIRFRVMRKMHDELILLFTSEIYSSAEEFCWKYDGIGELEIHKVWIRK